jgi:alpha-glucosidase
MSGMQRTQWWRTAAIYEVYVRSFFDSDGDGVGDLAGLRSRLPYLHELGVDALWLTPFYTSPMIDGGYDVADYRDVDPKVGSLADFDTLVASAHAYGIRIIVDIVPNHSSAQHEWFQAALSAGPGSMARQRYIFRPSGPDGDPPNDWESVFGGAAWTQVDDGEWYLHLFDPAQPDFNWSSGEVRAEFESILRFWLDRGVDGFRVDVAHGMIKAPGLPSVGRTNQIDRLGRADLPYFDQDEVHEIYRSWRKILDSYPGDRMAVAEAWAPSPERLARYIGPDELHQAFNFNFLDADWSVESFRSVIDASLAASGLVGAPSTWVLSNHDKRRHVSRYGSLAQARAAALLMLALPGSVYLYQGEELGLPEVLDIPDELRQDPVWLRSGGTEVGRDGCRVPLPWTGATAPFGFTSAPAAWLPAPADWAALTVSAQTGDPTSTLTLYQTALGLRRKAFTGDLTWLPAGEDVLSLVRADGARCVVNFGSTPITLDFTPTLTSGPLVDGALPTDTAAWFIPA